MALDAQRLGLDLRLEAMLVQGNAWYVRLIATSAERCSARARSRHYSSKEGGAHGQCLPAPAKDFTSMPRGCLSRSSTLTDNHALPGKPDESS